MRTKTDVRRLAVRLLDQLASYCQTRNAGYLKG